MRPQQLNLTLRLIRRTGDRALVMDMESSEIFVLMDLGNYEGMLDAIEGRQAENQGDLEDTSDNAAFEQLLAGESTQKNARPDTASEMRTEPELSAWPVAKEAPETSEPVVEPLKPPAGEEEALRDLPDDGEEEKFYLEPVE